MGVISIFTRLPLWVWLCAGLGVWGGLGHFKASSLQKEIDKSKLEFAQAVADAESKAREELQQKVSANAEVIDGLSKRARKAETDRVVLSQRVSWLQQQLKTASIKTDTDTSAYCGDYEERAKLYGKLLSESAELVAEGADRTRSLGSKNLALQEYIARVCLNANN